MERIATELATSRVSPLAVPAEDLYGGQQHLRLMRGVRRLREAPGAATLDLWILSAKYGLIAGCTPLEPYDETFNGLPLDELRSRGEKLNIPRRAREVLAGTADLVLVLLGEDYLATCKFDAGLRLGSPTVFLCSRRASAGLPYVKGLRAVRLSTSDTRRFHCGLISLKGEIAGRLLALLAAQPKLLTALVDDRVDLLGLIQEQHIPPPFVDLHTGRRDTLAMPRLM
jgi:hypothetical protein